VLKVAPSQVGEAGWAAGAAHAARKKKKRKKKSWAQRGLPLAPRPSVFLSFFLYNSLSFPLYFPGKTAWKSSNFWL